MIRVLICLCLLPCYAASANGLLLPAPGTMVYRSVASHPIVLKGIKVHADNPFKLEFLIDQGDQSRLLNDNKSEEPSFIATSIKEDSTTLIKYFLAALTTDEKDLWVNLSPYEKERIVPEKFGQTQMGRDLLAQDYILKQITASLIYPEDDIGKEFWRRVYQESKTKNIPIKSFNKVWIVPDKAVVYENAKENTAYVVESSLKVVTEQDYIASNINNSHDNSHQIVRNIIVPQLTEEINKGKNFAQLRQVYNSLILATWYKKRINKSLLTQAYANKNKINGITFADTLNVQDIYKRYVEAFKKGVFNYIKDVDTANGETKPIKYFSGGMDMAMLEKLIVIDKPNEAMLVEYPIGRILHAEVSLKGIQDAITFLRPYSLRMHNFLVNDLKEFIAAKESGQSIDLEKLIQKASELDTATLNFSKLLNLVLTAKSIEEAAPWIIQINKEYLTKFGVDLYLAGVYRRNAMHFALYNISHRKSYDTVEQGKVQVLYLSPLPGGMSNERGGHYMPHEQDVLVREDTLATVLDFIDGVLLGKHYDLHSHLDLEAKKIIKSDFKGMSKQQEKLLIEFLTELHELEHRELIFNNTKLKLESNPNWHVINETFAELRTLASGPASHFQLLLLLEKIEPKEGEWRQQYQDVLNRLAKKLGVLQRVEERNFQSAINVFLQIAKLPSERIKPAAQHAYDSLAWELGLEMKWTDGEVIVKAIEQYRINYVDAVDHAQTSKEIVLVDSKEVLISNERRRLIYGEARSMINELLNKMDTHGDQKYDIWNELPLFLFDKPYLFFHENGEMNKEEIDVYAKELLRLWQYYKLDRVYGPLFQTIAIHEANIFTSRPSAQILFHKRFLQFIENDSDVEKAFAMAQLILNHSIHLRFSGLHRERNEKDDQPIFLDNDLLIGDAKGEVALIQKYIMTMLSLSIDKDVWNAALPDPQGMPNSLGILVKDYLLWVLLLGIDPSIHTYITSKDEFLNKLLYEYWHTTDREEIMLKAVERILAPPLLKQQQKQITELIGKALSITDQEWYEKGFRSPFHLNIQTVNSFMLLRSTEFLDVDSWASYPLKNKFLMFGLLPEYLPTYTINEASIKPVSIKSFLSDTKNAYDLSSLGEILLEEQNQDLRPLYVRIYKASGILSANSAMKTNMIVPTGGIDLNTEKMGLDVINDGADGQFYFDHKQENLWQNMSGISPEIIKLTPVLNLKIFLGLSSR